MTQALVPCSRCARHVRTSSATCPFCAAAIDASQAASAEALRGRAVPRLGRAAVLAFGTSLVAAACGGGAAEAGGDQGDHGNVTAGSESTNSGGHGEDPNASDDPEGSDGVHEDTAPQPDPGGGAVAAYGAPAPEGVTP